jgi:hypothetical protein
LSAQAIIKQAADCGVSVSLNGDSLALKAATKPSASLLAKLKQHKAEIVAALRLEGGIAPPEPDEAEIEERKGMAMGGVPAAYADAWARLQIQKPMRVSDAEWRQAIDDADRFLDQRGSLAMELGWAAGELFDVPRDGRPGGLIWFIQGECVWGLGPEYAVLRSGEHVFDKTNAAASGSAVHKGGCDDARAYQGRAESSR